MSKNTEIVIGTPIEASKWNVDLGITHGREIEKLLGPLHKPLSYLQPPHPQLEEIIRDIRQSSFCPAHVGAKIIPVGSIEQPSFLDNIDPTLADMLDSRFGHVLEIGLADQFGHRRAKFERNFKISLGINGLSANGLHSLQKAMEEDLKDRVSAAVIRQLYINNLVSARTGIGLTVIERQDLAQQVAQVNRAILVGNPPIGIDVFRNVLTFLTA